MQCWWQFQCQSLASNSDICRWSWEHTCVLPTLHPLIGHPSVVYAIKLFYSCNSYHLAGAACICSHFSLVWYLKVKVGAHLCLAKILSNSISSIRGPYHKTFYNCNSECYAGDNFSASHLHPPLIFAGEAGNTPVSCRHFIHLLVIRQWSMP